MLAGAWVFALLLAQPAAVRDYQRASELFARHDLEGAETAVNESLRADPRYVPALTLKARLAMISGRLDVARETLRAAIAADPKLGSTRFLLGFCFYLENN